MRLAMSVATISTVVVSARLAVATPVVATLVVAPPSARAEVDEVLPLTITPAPEKIAEWVAQLDDDHFAIRETAQQIADALGTAEGTIKNHASSILSKLGVRDRTRAVLKALELGVI